MSQRSEVAPEPLSVDLTEEGIAVEYADGRSVFYHGVPEPVEGSVETAPGRDVHVLVTDAAESEGVLIYVDERRTSDEILESTGVGRVLLSAGEDATVFPGVRASAGTYRIEVEVDTETVDGRVFVFEEDETGERSFEVVGGTA